jgi:protein-disulfide isomerase
MPARAGLSQKRDNRDLNEYPEELKEEYLLLSEWVRELARQYKEKLTISLIDAKSLEGFLKSLRYGVRRYPAFIINKKKKYSGVDKAELQALLEQALS